MDVAIKNSVKLIKKHDSDSQSMYLCISVILSWIKRLLLKNSCNSSYRIKGKQGVKIYSACSVTEYLAGVGRTKLGKIVSIKLSRISNIFLWWYIRTPPIFLRLIQPVKEELVAYVKISGHRFIGFSHDDQACYKFITVCL